MSTGSTLGLLFGEPIPGAYSIVDAALNEIERNGSEIDRAIVENLRHDTRVSPARKILFLNRFLAHHSVNPATCVRDSLIEHYVMASGAEFHDLNVNRTNIVYGDDSQSPQLDHSTEFVSIFALFPPMRAKLEVKLKELDDQLFISGDAVEECFESIEKSGSGGIADSVKRGIVAAYNEFCDGQKSPARVTWVGSFDEFSLHKSNSPSFWMELYGLGHHLESNFRSKRSGTRNWFILLRYPASATRIVARPSVLDAGPCCWHHHSPGDLPAILGGRTMVIGNAFLNDEDPKSEFIHTERRFAESDILSIFRLEPNLDDVAGLTLSHLRQHHRQWITSWADDVRSRSSK